MDLKYLKEFYELAQFIETDENPSMSHFAIESGISEDLISQMIIDLEKELGCQLLIGDKTTTIKLTREGEIVAKRIPFILKELVLTKDLLKSLPNLDNE